MTVDGQEALFIPAGGGQAIQINQQTGQPIQVQQAPQAQQIQLGQGGQIQLGQGQQIQLGAGGVQLAGGQVLGQVFTVPKQDNVQQTFITPQGQQIQLGQQQQPQQTFVTPQGQIIRAPANMIPASNFPQTQTVQLPNGQTVQVNRVADHTNIRSNIPPF